jgi:hypothetical protein
MRRSRCTTRVCLAVTSTLSLLLLGDGHPADPAGAVRSTAHLPFSPHTLDVKESHIARQGESTLMKAHGQFDTTYMRHSILDALAEESDTKEFARWIDHSLEHEGDEKPLLHQLQSHLLWTIFAPSNSAVEKFLSDEQSKKERLHALQRHFIPDQSFVVFEGLSTKVIPMRTMARHTQVLVCDLRKDKHCFEDAPKPVNVSSLHTFILHPSDISVRNRLTGNGVVHVVERVFEKGELVKVKEHHRSADNATAAIQDDHKAAALVNDIDPSSTIDLWSSDHHGSSDSAHRPCTNCPPLKPTRVKAAPPPIRIHADGRHQLKAINMTRNEREQQTREEEGERRQHGENHADHQHQQHGDDGEDYHHHWEDDSHHNNNNNNGNSAHHSHLLQADIPTVNRPASGPSGGHAKVTNAQDTNVEILPGQPRADEPAESQGPLPSREDVDQSVPSHEDSHDGADSDAPPPPPTYAPPHRVTPLRGNGHPIPRMRPPPSGPESNGTLVDSNEGGEAESLAEIEPVTHATSKPSSSSWCPSTFRTWVYFSIALAVLTILTAYSLLQRIWPDRCARVKRRLCFCCHDAPEDEVNFEAVADRIDSSSSPLLGHKPLLRGDSSYQASEASSPPDL